MATNLIDSLNARHGLDGALSFHEKAPGIAVAHVRAGGAEAEISLYGAQLLSLKVGGAPDLLYLSSRSLFAPGKAIRGGVPVCWPWFGPRSDRPDLPVHGFVRTAQWDFESAQTLPEGMRISLATSSTPETKALWPHDFRLRLEITIGRRARLDLVMSNPGAEAYSATCAFHPYFRVGDVSGVSVLGMEGTVFADRLPGGGEATQGGAVRIDSLTDRLYACPGVKRILDPRLGREIVTAQEGFPSTVVWNPWEEKARAMPDMGEGEYRSMICVEPARVGGDACLLEPGQSLRLGFGFWSE